MKGSFKRSLFPVAATLRIARRNAWSRGVGKEQLETINDDLMDLMDNYDQPQRWSLKNVERRLGVVRTSLQLQARASALSGSNVGSTREAAAILGECQTTWWSEVMLPYMPDLSTLHTQRPF